MEVVDAVDCENRSCGGYNDDFRKNRRCGHGFESPESELSHADTDLAAAKMALKLAASEI